ncbi:fatty acyl CoA synthetase [Luteimonas pelagia]
MLACLAAAPCLAAEPAADAGWILQRLARPAPTRTPFLELRESPLLKAPLRVSGEYVRPDEDTLVRRVASPYAETTTIRAGQVAIERAGRVRRFEMSRAPELAGLQAGFGALLAGDRATIERHYAIEASGPRGDWTLRLVPSDATLASKLRDIVLYGRGAELRCIETRPVQGALQRTLVAGTARAAHGVDDAAALEALCRDGAA